MGWGRGAHKHFFDKDARPRTNFNYSKSRMTLNSNPQKIECPKIQTQKNRMTQDAMFVEVQMNMKSCYDFRFLSTVCSSCKGFECVIQKLKDPKNSWKFVRLKTIAEILQNPEK